MVQVEFIGDVEDHDGELVKPGRISIASYAETFFAPIGYWTPERYQQQWREGAQRIADRQPVSAFITRMYDPAKSAFIEWWPAWLEREWIQLQNQLLFLDQLTGPFDERDPYSHVGPQIDINEDGIRVSRWRAKIEG